NPPSNQLNVDVAVLGNVLSSSDSTTTVSSSNSSSSPSTTIVGSSSSSSAPAGVSSIKTPYVEKWLTFVEIVLRSPSTDPPCSSHLSSLDRKSTRLNSSHVSISYAVFCLKNKKSH